MTHEDILKMRDPSLPYANVSSSYYEDKHLANAYLLGCVDGINRVPGKRYNLEILNEAERAAYIHGYFTLDHTEWDTKKA